MSHVPNWDKTSDLFKLSWILFPVWWLSSMFPSCPLESKWSVRQIRLFLSRVLPKMGRKEAGWWFGLGQYKGSHYCLVTQLLCVYLCRSITLDNQLVVLATTAADAGRYHVEAVNDMTGENATSPAVYLSVSGEEGLLSSLTSLLRMSSA